MQISVNSDGDDGIAIDTEEAVAGDLFSELEDDEEDMYGSGAAAGQFDVPSGPAVFTTSHLVGAPQGRIPINKAMSVVCGLVNDGEEALNVTGIFGTLNDPVEGNVVMNFTGIPVNETLAGDSEVSYAYRFKMPPGTPQQSFQMMFHVFYTVGNGRAQAPITFYNQTVEMYETDEMDWEGVGAVAENLFFFFAVVGSAAGLFVWSMDAPASANVSTGPTRIGRAAGSSAMNRRKGKKKPSSKSR